MRRPRNLFFSSRVWKRPWPNFDEVSMNLRVTSSTALRLVCSKSDLRSVTTRFFGPTMQPWVGLVGMLVAWQESLWVLAARAGPLHHVVRARAEGEGEGEGWGSGESTLSSM